MCCTQGVLKGRTGGIKICGTRPSLKKEKKLEEQISHGDPSPGHRMLRTLHSSYRMQSILTESTETFLCSLFQAGEAAPALVSAAKERKHTCQTFWREFVRMEVMLAEIHHVHPLHYQNQRILAPWSLEPQLASFDQSI
jgi:hypothetical protein